MASACWQPTQKLSCSCRLPLLYVWVALGMTNGMALVVHGMDTACAFWPDNSVELYGSELYCCNHCRRLAATLPTACSCCNICFPCCEDKDKKTHSIF